MAKKLVQNLQEQTDAFVGQARQTRGNIFNLGNAIIPIAGLIPGAIGDFARNFASGPAGSQFLRRAAGQEATEFLEAARPELTGPSLTESAFTFTGPGGEEFNASLPEIGRRAIAERVATFDALSDLGREQQAETDEFRSQLAEALAQGRRMDQLLRQSTSQGAAEYNAAIQQANALRFEARAFLKLAFQTSADLLKELRDDATRVRDEFDADIVNRASSVAAGIQSNSRASFEQHVRAIEAASGPLSPDERASIRSMYERDAGRQTAMAVGSLHEAAADRKVTADTQLNTNLTAATNTIISNLTGATINAAEMSRASADMRAQLAEGKANHLRTMALARVELSQYVAGLALDGQSRLFDLVTATTRPVAIFSDILFSMFDAAWSVQAFENDLELQRFQIEAAIRNPLEAAFIDAVGQIERNQQLEAQQKAADDANSAATTGAIIGVAGTVLAPFTGGLSLVAAGAANSTLTNQVATTNAAAPGNASQITDFINNANA